MKVDLGDIIRESILAHNLTQKKAAKELHISQQAMSSYVNNHRQPSLECFFNMIDFLGLDTSIFKDPRLEHQPTDALILQSIANLKRDQKKLIVSFIMYFEKENRK